MSNSVPTAVSEAHVHLTQAGFTLTYEWVICSQLYIYPRFLCLFSTSMAVHSVVHRIPHIFPTAATRPG